MASKIDFGFALVCLLATFTPTFAAPAPDASAEMVCCPAIDALPPYYPGKCGDGTAPTPYCGHGPRKAEPAALLNTGVQNPKVSYVAKIWW
ncbi:hypothetical protein AJ80_03955 [Polytolypa hystricis UAMH7299]|uniref:Uncharacterized protein n=1 Tax=Polytolypa hystricis (strain UAMH7299) TaxID=1447883 RepID=A0A2B7Y5L5_POLH7|nr:hypothetical protein AJ80_03955 [Polytolypa hystricis UAMH7299]